MTQTTKILGLLSLVGVLCTGMVYYKHYNKPTEEHVWEISDSWNVPQESPIEYVENNRTESPTTAEDYHKAIDMGKQYNKNIVVFFTSVNCRWCQKMKQETLSDASVKKALSNYVFVMVDLSTKNKRPVNSSDYEVGRKFNVQKLPTFLVVTPNEKETKRGAGYLNGNQFIDWLKN